MFCSWSCYHDNSLLNSYTSNKSRDFTKVRKSQLQWSITFRFFIFGKVRIFGRHVICCKSYEDQFTRALYGASDACLVDCFLIAGTNKLWDRYCLNHIKIETSHRINLILVSVHKKRSYRDKQEVRPTAEKVGLQKMARTLRMFHECSTIKTSVTFTAA